MRKTLFMVSLLMLTFTVFAQDKDSTEVKIKKFTYNASYCGNNIWNPGLKIGFEYLLQEREKTKIKIRRGKEFHKTKYGHLILDGNIGGYWDPRSHTGLYTYYGIHFRRIRPKGFRFRVGVSPIGYYRSVLPDTYEVDDAGNVEKVNFPGNDYYCPTLTLGIGKATKKDRFYNSWHLQLNTMFLIKYNAGFLPLLNLEFGFGF